MTIPISPIRFIAILKDNHGNEFFEEDSISTKASISMDLGEKAALRMRTLLSPRYLVGVVAVQYKQTGKLLTPEMLDETSTPSI